MCLFLLMQIRTNRYFQNILHIFSSFICFIQNNLLSLCHNSKEHEYNIKHSG